jgi:hypothetical protein
MILRIACLIAFLAVQLAATEDRAGTPPLLGWGQGIALDDAGNRAWLAYGSRKVDNDPRPDVVAEIDGKLVLACAGVDGALRWLTPLGAGSADGTRLLVSDGRTFYVGLRDTSIPSSIVAIDAATGALRSGFGQDGRLAVPGRLMTLIADGGDLHVVLSYVKEDKTGLPDPPTGFRSGIAVATADAGTGAWRTAAPIPVATTKESPYWPSAALDGACLYLSVRSAPGLADPWGRPLDGGEAAVLAIDLATRALRPSFGKSGVVVLPQGRVLRLATTGGNLYVLCDGRQLWALGDDGRPLPAFGNQGSVDLGSYHGDLAAVDGRLLAIIDFEGSANTVLGCPAIASAGRSDMRVVAIDPRSGRPVPSFADHGSFAVSGAGDEHYPFICARGARAAISFATPSPVVTVAGHRLHNGDFEGGTIGFSALDGRLEPSVGLQIDGPDALRPWSSPVAFTVTGGDPGQPISVESRAPAIVAVDGANLVPRRSGTATLVARQGGRHGFFQANVLEDAVVAGYPARLPWRVPAMSVGPDGGVFIASGASSGDIDPRAGSIQVLAGHMVVSLSADGALRWATPAGGGIQWLRAGPEGVLTAVRFEGAMTVDGVKATAPDGKTAIATFALDPATGRLRRDYGGGGVVVSAPQQLRSVPLRTHWCAMDAGLTMYDGRGQQVHAEAVASGAAIQLACADGDDLLVLRRDRRLDRIAAGSGRVVSSFALPARIPDLFFPKQMAVADGVIYILSGHSPNDREPGMSKGCFVLCALRAEDGMIVDGFAKQGVLRIPNLWIRGQNRSGGQGDVYVHDNDIRVMVVDRGRLLLGGVFLREGLRFGDDGPRTRGAHGEKCDGFVAAFDAATGRPLTGFAAGGVLRISGSREDEVCCLAPGRDGNLLIGGAFPSPNGGPDGSPPIPPFAKWFGMLLEVGADGLAVQRTATVRLDDLRQQADGRPRAVRAVTEPPGLAVALSYDGAAEAPIGAGTCTVVGTVVQYGWKGSATAALVVDPGIIAPVPAATAAVIAAVRPPPAATAAPPVRTQAIAWDPPKRLRYRGVPLTVRIDAVDSDGRPAVLEVVSGPATAAGLVLTVAGTGRLVVAATGADGSRAQAEIAVSGGSSGLLWWIAGLAAVAACGVVVWTLLRRRAQG